MKAECSSDTVLQSKTQTWPFQVVVLDFGAFCSLVGRYQRSFSPEDGDSMFFPETLTRRQNVKKHHQTAVKTSNFP
jgi:hypothetical protein